MAKSKVPKFGDWQNGGDIGYTGYFETARKPNPGGGGGPLTNPNDIQMNRDVQSPAAPKPKPKQPSPPPQQQKKPPKFGAWEEGDDVPYTQYFDHQNKTNPKEREAGPSHQPKAPPKPHGVKFVGPEPRHQPKAPAPAPAPAAEQRTGGRGRGSAPASARPQQRPPASRGPNPGRGGSVPVFGDWNNNPGQAGGYTVVFDKLHDDKKKKGPNVPSVDNPPISHRNTPSRPINESKQSGCFSRLFK